MGFCVAITKNGGLGSGCVWPPMAMTCRSCMAPRARARSGPWPGRELDFVGEDEVRKDRAAVGRELAGFRLEDHRADDIAGEKVGGELDALELDAEGDAEGLDEERLGEAGHALEEDVAVGEEGDEQVLDGGILADDGLADFVAKFL